MINENKINDKYFKVIPKIDKKENLPVQYSLIKDLVLLNKKKYKLVDERTKLIKKSRELSGEIYRNGLQIRKLTESIEL